ncbi:group-specific protein [Shouchella miscanthi]|uniref:group-specific protein n=1 Tax=Shouchella miscanthi TaxID=2598861 RepID=UPI0011A7CC60|nr:group-specific protein [Shouchella miscanthi]
MTFYIASSFRNVEAVRTLATSLQKLGYTQTYDWTQHQRASEAQELKTIGELEKQAVERARFFILLLPAGKGSHVELGLALATNKPIIIHSPPRTTIDPSTFYYLNGVTHSNSELSDLPTIIDEWVRST